MGGRISIRMLLTSSIMPKSKNVHGKERVIMAGWDGDTLAGSMEEALERQQEAAEERRARKDTSSQEEVRAKL